MFLRGVTFEKCSILVKVKKGDDSNPHEYVEYFVDQNLIPLLRLPMVVEDLGGADVNSDLCM